jgi:hypothetical protein
MWKLLTAALALCTVVASQPVPQAAPQPREVMSWVPPYRLEQSRQVLQRSAGAVTADQFLSRVGLQFWMPTLDGGVRFVPHREPVGDAEVTWFRAWGRPRGVKLLLTIYNHDGTSWNWDLARAAFVTHQDAFVRALVGELERTGLDGIDLDLEGNGALDAERPGFAVFVRKLSAELRPRGKLLTVDSFHSPCFNAPHMGWWEDWTGRVDAIHSMGYGDLYEGSTEVFTPDKGTPCRPGETIFRFSWQVAWGTSHGFQPGQILLGLPGGRFEWGQGGRGATLPAHLDEVRATGGGICIWDVPGLGGGRDPRAGSEEAWAALARFRRGE